MPFRLVRRQGLHREPFEDSSHPWQSAHQGTRARLPRNLL